MASLEDKAAFFNQLKFPDDDDEFDTVEQRERKRCRDFFKPKPSPTHHSSTQNPARSPATTSSRQTAGPTPRRVVSAPLQLQRSSTQIIKGTPLAAFAQTGRISTLLSNNTASPDLIIVGETPIPEPTKPIQRTLARSNTTPMLPSKRLLGLTQEDSPSVAMKRRKREPAVKSRPEGERIFAGLSFFYVPDNDIAPARRLRIAKAREYGATWTRVAGHATHVVVEKNINFKDIGGVLAGANKASPPKVVNEDYPLDCIQFKALLRHDQKKYQVVGQPAVQDADRPVATPSSSEESVRSLQLKPPPKNPKKWDYVPPAGTPSRSEQSSQDNQQAGTAFALDSQPVILDIDQIIPSSDQVSDDNDLTINEQNDHGSSKENHKANTSTKSRATRGTDLARASVETGHSDELSEYITLMLEYKDLPLDVDEDDAHSIIDLTEAASEIDDSYGSEAERAQRRKSTRKKTRSGRKDLAYEDRFACNSAGVKNANAGNPNSRTIEVLQLMANYYDRVNDHWRTTAYRKAISTLKRQDTKVTTEAEAFQLPSIGQRLAQKIEEIVTTDRLKRLEYAQDEPMDASLQLFLGIYGVGTSQAQQWISQGFRTLDDLKAKAKLSQNQLVGIDHYEDLNTRIPRREVQALGAVVQRAANKMDPEVELIIGGSYRRGAETSGDIDFIVTKPNTSSTGELHSFLDALVQKLQAEQFLVATLAASRSATDGSKWHGCCVLPKIQGLNDNDYRPIWRRIDFLLVPETQMGAALIYFTGNDIFNRSMRLLASRKGMRLNQRGLYKDVMRGPQRVKVTEGELVEGRDERRIFEILGVKWREPHERWC